MFSIILLRIKIFKKTENKFCNMELPPYLCLKLIKMKKISWLILIGVCVSIFSFTLDNNDEYFEIANQRIKKYNPKNKNLVIIVDYRKNILSERLYILDMKNKKIVLSSRVSHALSSGVMNANQFSNTPNSRISSNGNFITEYSYNGKLGYSMKIKGLDKGINNNAKSRGIIFHQTFPPFLWSFGCFATLPHVNEQIINMTKNGTLVCVIN